MSGDSSTQVQIMESATKDINRLCLGDSGFGAKFTKFLEKFQKNYEHPGLHTEKLHDTQQDLRSARIDKGMRAVFLAPQGRVWTLVRVGGHEVYDEIKRTLFSYSDTDGRIEYIVAREAQVAETPHDRAETRSRTADDSGPFQAWTDAELTELGVNPAFLPSVRALRTESEAEALLSDTSGLSRIVLESLLLGMAYDEVYEQVTAPSGSTPVKDFDEALDRSADRMTSSDAVIDAILSGDWSTWRLFLHPDQRKAVAKDYRGPARVSGGPGTGKTVVVIHRACELAKRLDSDGRILVATFNVALTNDIKNKITSLGGKQVASRIEVINVDSLARRIFKDAVGENRSPAKDAEIKRLWDEAIAQAGETANGFNPDFLKDEYNDVILAGGLRERREYLQTARRGRGRRLSRADRIAVWDLTTRFESLLEREGKTTWGKVAAVAADHAEDKASGGTFPYAHILVDEAQDLNPQHWRMLRHLVAADANDLFLAADSHQRLYQKPIVLSGLGIDIRGRATRLKLNYRTSREILSRTIPLLGGADFEDFDEVADTLDGYRSVLSGGRVDVCAVERSEDEIKKLVEGVQQWRTENPTATIGIAGSTRERVGAAKAALDQAGIAVSPLNAAGSEGEGRVYVDTMFAMKGLEFQYVACIGLGEAHFPPKHLRPAADDDQATANRKLQQAQSLLFVTATRARDQLALIYSGPRSEVLGQFR